MMKYLNVIEFPHWFWQKQIIGKFANEHVFTNKKE